MLGYLTIQADIVAFFVLIARLLLYLHHKTNITIKEKTVMERKRTMPDFINSLEPNDKQQGVG